MEYAGSPFELKSLSDAGHIEGLLAGFGLDSHGDVIDTKAFKRTLAERDGRPLPMLLHHDMKRPIGAWKQFKETGDGLYVTGELTMSTRDAQDARALAQTGALTGLSIGFRTKTARMDQRSGINHLLNIDLVEGSLVTVPSNPKTYVATIKTITGPRDIAELLQASGLSNRQSKAAAGAAWRSINSQDDEEAADAELAQILNASANRILTLGAR